LVARLVIPASSLFIYGRVFGVPPVRVQRRIGDIPV